MAAYVGTTGTGIHSGVTHRPFCRSCGQVAAPDEAACSSCGASLVPPRPAADDSFEAIGVKTAGTRKAGAGTFPIIRDEGRKWFVLAMNGAEVSLKKKDAELSSALKPAGRVQRWVHWCNHATSDQGLQQFWNRALAAASTEWDGRLMAQWALSKTRLGLLDGLNLSQSELTWLKIHSAIRVGKFEDTLHWIARLEDGTYPDILDLLGYAVAKGLPLAQAQKVQDKVAALDPHHPVALLLSEAPLAQWKDVQPAETPVLRHLRQAALFAVGQSEDAPGSGPLATLAKVERSLVGGESLPRESLSIPTTTLDLLLLWQERADPGGIEVRSDPKPLDDSWAPYADDLLEQWSPLSTAQQTWLEQIIRGSTGSAWESVTRRLDVLSGEGEAGSPCEEARRAYVSGDWSYLRNAGGHGEYFLALADLRDGDATATDRLQGHECLPLEGKRTLDLLETLVAGQHEQVSILVQDPTLWETLVKLDVPAESIVDTPLRFREWHHLTKAKQALYDDHFSEAAKIARECLRISTIEDIRDEALNLLGVALLSEGNAEAAATAFDKAIEDAHSDRLLVNWAIVRSASASDGLGDHWLEVAKKADHSPLRAAAGLRALSNLDDENGEAQLTSIAREVLFSAGDLDTAMAYLPIVGRHDSTWFQGQDWSTSPFFESSAFKVRVALYHSDQDHLEVLGNLLRKHPEDQELLEIRDSVVDSVMAVMGGAGDDEDENQLGIAAWGLQMLDVVPLKPRQEAILSLWSVQVALQHFGRDYEDDELPGEGLLKFVTRAEALVVDDSKGFDEDDKRFVSRQAAILRDEYAQQNITWHAHAHDRAVDTYNGFIDSIRSIGYGQRLDKQKVRAAAQEFSDSCQLHINEVSTALQLVSDEDLRQMSNNLLSAWKELQSTAQGLKRSV